MENGPRGIGGVPNARGKNLSVICSSLFFVLIAVSGTPGVGKTAVANALEAKGWHIVELNEFALAEDLLGKKDRGRDTFEVDVESLDNRMMERRWKDRTLLVGHLAHLLSVDMVIVLRCSPRALEARLKGRDWSDEKIRENLEAEACDVILIEAMESVDKVYEIDTTKRSPEQVASAVKDIVKGNTERYVPGDIGWGEEVLDWY